MKKAVVCYKDGTKLFLDEQQAREFNIHMADEKEMVFINGGLHSCTPSSIMHFESYKDYMKRIGEFIPEERYPLIEGGQVESLLRSGAKGRDLILAGIGRTNPRLLAHIEKGGSIGTYVPMLQGKGWVNGRWSFEQHGGYVEREEVKAEDAERKEKREKYNAMTMEQKIAYAENMNKQDQKRIDDLSWLD